MTVKTLLERLSKCDPSAVVIFHEPGAPYDCDVNHIDKKQGKVVLKP